MESGGTLRYVINPLPLSDPSSGGGSGRGCLLKGYKEKAGLVSGRERLHERLFSRGRKKLASADKIARGGNKCTSLHSRWLAEARIEQAGEKGVQVQEGEHHLKPKEQKVRTSHAKKITLFCYTGLEKVVLAAIRKGGEGRK